MQEFLLKTGVKNKMYRDIFTSILVLGGVVGGVAVFLGLGGFVVGFLVSFFVVVVFLFV